MQTRAFHPDDESAVISLWGTCDLARPWNDPHLDIARKMTEHPALFLVGVIDEKIMATAMFGYDGHRGWVNYLAISPKYQRSSFGRQLMEEGERLLQALGCPKLNLQIRTGNSEVIEFYRKLGYTPDDVISMGKRF
jgi:ribosomal protein S18 acetylase RimI-like enzyme